MECKLEQIMHAVEDSEGDIHLFCTVRQKLDFKLRKPACSSEIVQIISRIFQNLLKQMDAEGYCSGHSAEHTAGYIHISEKFSRTGAMINERKGPFPDLRLLVNLCTQESYNCPKVA